MYEKVINYEDFNGEKQSQKYYFALNKSELYKMNARFDGGLKAYYEKMMNERNAKALSEFFDQLIYMSYGEREADGNHFIKKDMDGHDLALRFMQTPAYDELYIELLSDLEAAASFIIGILPSEMGEAAKAEYVRLQKENELPSADVIDVVPATNA